MEINYQKRKNLELFEAFKSSETLNLSNVQNYIPIYNQFFSLNETNYNSINLNNLWYLTNISCKLDNCDDEDFNESYSSTVKNVNTKKTKSKNVFFKLAPLLDPYKYLSGKYNTDNNDLFNLPTLSNSERVNSKLLNVNNSSYVDGIFSFLSGQLIKSYNFVNGLEYYGSYLAIKNDYVVDISEELDYLIKTPFFKKNNNILFSVQDEYLMDYDDKKPQLKINHNTSEKSKLILDDIDDVIFDDVFEDLNNVDVKEQFEDLINITTDDLVFECDPFSKKQSSLHSSSSYSSRTSNTSSEHSEDGDVSSISNSEEDTTSSCSEDIIDATIKRFPIQVICMEKCENTFDSFILKSQVPDDEIFSAFMQIIMTLIIYQKTFNFTHNDLHTNNVMYTTTTLKYVWYCYKKKYYKVPTFGKIYKIIDFGRSIYKFNGKLFCSDSFELNGDAYGQYNTEPFFNENKQRIEPNYSFDLCRLACSIFDYVVGDLDEITDLSKCSAVVKFIVELCQDDNGVNLLYKQNGLDRYPDFKLYKMISRCSHKHTPHSQLERPEFKKYIVSSSSVVANDTVVNIDNIPILI